MSTKPYKTPPIRTESDSVVADYTEEHPSYGVLSINRMHGSGQALFGSSIEHHETISLSIKRAHKTRHLNYDSFYSTEEIIEVWMSPTQFANAITNFSQGEGTPVTIRYCSTGNLEEIPLPEYQDVKSEFRDEFAQKVQDVSVDLEEVVHELKELMLKPTISKTRLKEVLSKITSAQIGIASNMPFVLDQFHEQMDKTVHEAKGEVEALISRKIEEAGLTALAQGELPLRLLDEGKKG